MRKIQFFSILMIFWIILNEKINIIVVLFGTLFSIIVILISYKIIFELHSDKFKFPPVWRFIWFSAVISIEIIKSATRHVFRILKGNNTYDVFEVTLNTDNLIIITLISNAITLTPGTITIDVEDSTLKVLGFVNSLEDIEKTRSDILKYQNPFINRR